MTEAANGGEAPRAQHPLLRRVDAGNLPRLPQRPCPYLPGRQIRERAFLAERMPGELYHDLMDRGFRRSGTMFYATDCPDCRACVPLRVPVATFAPTRSQRRVARRNDDLTVTVRAPEFTPATFALYRRYVQQQHGRDDAAAEETSEQFRASLYADVVDTVEVVYALAGEVLAISLLDVCSRSVSAVYHFYDPDHHRRSLGVYSVLAEIEWTRQLGVPFYYLGYWVQDAKTMHYKANYGPHELLGPEGWRRVDVAKPAGDRSG
jgi:arginyl-tRNA--protein-N-Asp/Glu arginylyltransferase